MIFGVYGWMIASGVIFKSNPTAGGISQVASMILMVSFLIVKDFYFTVQASKYHHIRAKIFPDCIVKHFFVKKGPWQNQPVKGLRGMNTSILPLGEKTKYGKYGEIDTMIIKHDGSLMEKLNPIHGKAKWHGVVVDHDTSSEIWVRHDGTGGVDVNRSIPIPSFRLLAAQGDGIRGIMHSSALNLPENPDKRKLVLALQKAWDTIKILKSSLAERTRQSRDKTRAVVYHSERADHLSDELGGVLDEKTDVVKAKWELMLMHRREQTRIENALRGHQPWRKWLGSWVAYPIIAGLIIAFLAAKPELLENFSKGISNPRNQMFVIIVLVIVAGLIYYLFKRRKK